MYLTLGQPTSREKETDKTRTEVRTHGGAEDHGRETKGEGKMQNKTKKQIESEGGERKGLTTL